ncbi:MAG: glycosyltransferase family 4 protein [Flavobacteriia bacterium]|nr:glycosyltransferase family 4 protein [Flavobacteriia bacterium]
MRILIVHNRYQRMGGEDTVVQMERVALVNAGHDVSIFEVTNDDIFGFTQKLCVAVKVSGSSTFEGAFMNAVRDFNPDIVHIHNFFPLLSPRVHLWARSIGVGVVQTLHNFRLICGAGTFLRDGAICEKCLDGSSLNGVRHACYRESRLGSLSVLSFQRATRFSDKWLGSVDRFICLTEFARQKFVRAGLPERRVVVKPNFVVDSKLWDPAVSRNGRVLFVGRLTVEKGVVDYLRVAKELPEVSFDIIGDGPEINWIANNKSKNVTLHGWKSPDAVSAALGNASLLVLPSRWYEGFPMTLVEAMSVGTPIVASDLGAMSEILRGRNFAKLFPVGNIMKMRDCILDVLGDCSGAKFLAAREEYLECYSEGVNVRQLERIYFDALGSGL